MEESVWVGDVIHALETGTLPFRKRNGSQIKYTASLEEQASFRQQLDAQFSNLYVNAHDAFEWLKGFRRDADAFAAKYCVDDATLPVASKQTAPVETPAPATGGTLAASAAPISRKNKSEKTLKLETTVLRLMTHFWNHKPSGTTPTKGELSESVYKEMLRTQIRGRGGKLTTRMVADAATPWVQPIVLPAFVPDAQIGVGRHPFKGAK